MSWKENEEYLLKHGFILAGQRDENASYKGSCGVRILRKNNIEVGIIYHTESNHIIMSCSLILNEDKDFQTSEMIMSTDASLLKAVIVGAVPTSFEKDKLYTKEQKRGGMSDEVFLKVVTGDLNKFWMKVDNLTILEILDSL